MDGTLKYFFETEKWKRLVKAGVVDEFTKKHLKPAIEVINEQEVKEKTRNRVTPSIS